MLENRFDLGGKEKGRAGRLVGPSREGSEDRTGLREAVVPQLLCRALGPGPGDQEAVGEANCMFPPGRVTSHPATWLPATEKASVSFLVSGGRGHVWGQVYHLAGGGRSQGSRGLNAHSLRAPASLENSFSFLLPAVWVSLARLQRDPAGLSAECHAP